MILENQKVTSLHDAYELLSGKLQSWLVAVVRLLPNFIVAIVIIVLFFFLGRLFRRITHKFLGHLKNKTVELLIGNIVFTVISITGLFIALGVLNLDKTVTSLLAGAGIIGLAMSFAFQDIAQNFISGVSMAVRRPFDVGDTIEVNSKRGVVQQLNLRTTELINSSGEAMFIPNKEIYQNTLINSSKGERVRVRIPIEIKEGHDLQLLQERIIAALERQPKILDNTVAILFTEITAEVTKAEVRFFVDRGEDDALIKSKAIKAIDPLLKAPVK